MTGTADADPTAVNRAAYDRIASAYAARTNPAAPLFFGPVRRRFLDAVPAAATVLDVGCGPGRLLPVFAAAGLRPVGLDSSAAMLGLAIATGHPVVRADLIALPVGDASVDAIWCQAALLHVPDELTAAVLAGFVRVLRRGGRLGVVTAVTADGTGAHHRFEDDDEPGVRRWFVYRDSAAFVRVIAEAGLAVAEVEHLEGRRRRWIAVVATRPP